MPTFQLLDKVQIELKITVHSVATRRIAGLDSEDVLDYLEAHAKTAVNEAMCELQLGDKSLKELGFSYGTVQHET